MTFFKSLVSIGMGFSMMFGPALDARAQYEVEPSYAAGELSWSIKRFEKRLADAKTEVRDHSWWDYLTDTDMTLMHFLDSRHTIFERLNKRLSRYVGWKLYYEYSALDTMDKELIAAANACDHPLFDRVWQRRGRKALTLKDQIERSEKELLAFYDQMAKDWRERMQSTSGQLKTALGIDPAAAPDVSLDDYFMLEEEDRIKIEFLKARSEFFNYYQSDMRHLFNKIDKDRDALKKFFAEAREVLATYGVSQITFSAACETSGDYCPIDYYQKGRELARRLYDDDSASRAFEFEANRFGRIPNEEILKGLSTLETPMSGREGTSGSDIADRMAKLPVGLQKNILRLLRELYRQEYKYGTPGHPKKIDRVTWSTDTMLKRFPEGSMLHESIKRLSGIHGWEETYKELYYRVRRSMHKRVQSRIKENPNILKFLDEKNPQNRHPHYESFRREAWLAEEFENLNRYLEANSADDRKKAAAARSQEVKDLLDEAPGGAIERGDVGMNEPKDWQGVRQLEAAFDAETPQEQEKLLDAWEADIRKRVYEEAFEMTDENIDALLSETDDKNEGLPLPAGKQSNSGFKPQEFKSLIEETSKDPEQLFAALENDLTTATALADDALNGMTSTFDARLKDLELVQPVEQPFDAGGGECKISDEVAIYPPTAEFFQSFQNSCPGIYIYESQDPDALKRQGLDQCFEFYDVSTGEYVDLSTNKNISIHMCANGSAGDLVRDENDRVIAFNYFATIGGAMGSLLPGKKRDAATTSQNDLFEAEKDLGQQLRDITNFGLSFDGGGQNIGNGGLPAAPTIDDGPTFEPPLLNDFQPDQSIGIGGGNTFSGGSQSIGRK